MFRRFAKKRTVLALSVVAVLALAGGAYAYFSTSGSGTGQASVGKSTKFQVSFGTTTGAMYPGTGTSNVPYTITNPTGSGVQNLSSTGAAVNDDGTGNITEHGSSIAGCLSTWFTATDKPPAYGPIADGGSVNGSVDVTMSNVSSSQDKCQGHTPDINVSAS